MPCNCVNLLIVNTKVVKPGGNVAAASYHCKLKRESREIAKEINNSYQRLTQISVAGYTCYYCENNVVKCSECPKFAVTK
jgi:hypothetical protein